MSAVPKHTISVDGVGRSLTPLGFGSFKLGRNQGVKYPTAYSLPSEQEAARLLNSVLDLGCNLIDTAPAYGLSEERIGRAIGHRRCEFLLSTKVGETFENGQSAFDFSERAVRLSLERSFERLQTDRIDFVFIHSNGEGETNLRQSPVVSVLQEYRAAGRVGRVGLSGKTVEGARLALEWADALMVEYNLGNSSHEAVITEATNRGAVVFVKKGLSSGHAPAAESIRFVLGHHGVTSLVVGGLSLEHFQENWRVAMDLTKGGE